MIELNNLRVYELKTRLTNEVKRQLCPRPAQNHGRLFFSPLGVEYHLLYIAIAQLSE